MADLHNPYAPPAAEPEPRGDRLLVARDRNGDVVRAGHGRRFLGALLDGVFNAMVGQVVGWALGFTTWGFLSTVARERATGPGGAGGWVTALLIHAVQGLLIARRSQSLGKLVVGTRIVLPDGRPAGLVHGFLLRMLPLTLVAWLPTLAVLAGMNQQTVTSATGAVGLVWLLDVAQIFRAGTRCGHDMLAGTVVGMAAKGPDDTNTDSARRPLQTTGRRRRRA